MLCSVQTIAGGAINSACVRGPCEGGFASLQTKLVGERFLPNRSMNRIFHNLEPSSVPPLNILPCFDVNQSKLTSKGDGTVRAVKISVKGVLSKIVNAIAQPLQAHKSHCSQKFHSSQND
jgi:hypothetical protein